MSNKDSSNNDSNNKVISRQSSITIGLLLAAVGTAYLIGDYNRALKSEIETEVIIREKEREQYIEWNQNLYKILDKVSDTQSDMSSLLNEHEKKINQLAEDVDKIKKQ